MTSKELLALNPGYNIDKIQIGEVLTLSEAVPYLTVTVKQREYYVEDVMYDVEYTDSAYLYKGDYQVTSPGEYGAADVVANVTYVTVSYTHLRWMQAPAVPQLGPQGRDPLTPLLPAGADPFAQQPPQSGQHSPGQQKQLHRKPLRLREPLCLFLPYQTPPVAAGILGLFRQRLAAGHHRADLPLRVLPGLHSLPQPPAPGL